MSQGLFNFSLPPVDPKQERAAPFQSGNHASWTGAQAQVEVWTEKRSELLQCLKAGGPMSRNELAAVLKWPVSSVCSVLDAVRSEIEFADYETVTWTSYGRSRTTRRERFKVKS